jgi:hypothetical protein
MTEPTNPGTGALDVTEAASAKVAKAPRVTLDDIKRRVIHHVYLQGTGDLLDMDYVPAEPFNIDPIIESLSNLSICILVLDNGFTVIGKSAPVNTENFNAELGLKLAYDDAIRQVWPLMGFAMCEDRLAQRRALFSEGNL